MIVRESINFERGKSPEEIKRLFGREYHPGEILLRPDNGYSPHTTIMMFKRRTKPDYVGNEYFEVATLGYIDTEGKTKYYGYRFELDNYNTENMVSVDTKDIRFPNPKEELILKKFFNKSKISKIKERLGIFPILNGKKLNESLDFERGLDPKDSMGIGTPLARLANELGMTYAEIRQDKKDLESIVAAAVNPGEDEDKDYSFAFYAVADDPMAYDITRESRLFDVALWADQHQKDAIRILRTPDRISESVNFERGVDPKKAAGIGLSSPKRFKNIEEFTNHIIAALPLIFGGKIPEDILSKREGGMLPESYYGKIAYWLAENGFEMPNGNNDWEGPIDNAPKEFAYWTTPITQRLEQMLGEKRWSEYN